jgi:hypothetical protein
MDYTKLFEKIRLEAEEKGAKDSAAFTEMMQDVLFHALGQDPEMVAFPLSNLKQSIKGLEKLIKTLRGSSAPWAANYLPVIEGCCKAMQACAMAIWYKEKAIERLVDGIIDDPMAIHKDFLAIRNSMKE